MMRQLLLMDKSYPGSWPKMEENMCISWSNTDPFFKEVFLWDSLSPVQHMLITHMYTHNKNKHSRVISYSKTSCPLSVMSSLGPSNDGCKFFKQEPIILQKLQALLQSVSSASNISLTTTGISNLSLTYIPRTYIRTSHNSVIITIALTIFCYIRTYFKHKQMLRVITQ